MGKDAVVARVKRYADRVAREFPVRMVVLFGSQVSGEASPDSDIDVAVVFEEITGDYLTAAARLCALRNDIDPMIEPHLLTERGESRAFLREVLRTGEVLYSAA
jgi:predicted nucleotidyltransferase